MTAGDALTGLLRLLGALAVVTLRMTALVLRLSLALAAGLLSLAGVGRGGRGERRRRRGGSFARGYRAGRRLWR
ncbi:hypothetical protein CLV92_11264 [Kineococcus xinjiangensis]|uniref:Uncharacterized protein n=1 Tax=Kineococcus xinjiangensis TaxID=512762 RepID=A0A2S6IFA8_9ACTN|nr:hypothetical protein [Kineococcus xinjiangensis]PPK92891.1 hypothetical protein CLV92_11264 [Kineococcus xinjiangensis]